MHGDTLIEFLQRALEARVLHGAVSEDSVTLTEEDPKGRMEVTIDAIDMPFVVVKPQQVGHLGCTRGREMRWVCDYLVICGSSGQRCSAVFVELKKTLGPRSRATEQLRRSLPLLRYLEALYAVDSGTSEVPANVGYVVFYERGVRLDKQITRGGQVARKLKHRGIEAWALMVPGPFRLGQLPVSYA